ncbi:MAG: hypothetical protein DRJ33_04090 [Candidatus Methanomethylicota archaeon]|uniref:Uncharacterized protein n=1 Tax=Thermoproteota archaeon TaxID=2056631 RepID=A0A497EZ64_9CREN|nr:MAG: hypothetical protein DRJ33_04090 [Candidatus Verstraetearchaeota archaeon]
MEVDIENPQTVWEAIEEYLKKNAIASVTELNRVIPVNRNWLAGFLAAGECFGFLERKGTKTHKLYALKLRSSEK